MHVSALPFQMGTLGPTCPMIEKMNSLSKGSPFQPSAWFTCEKMHSSLY